MSDTPKDPPPPGSPPSPEEVSRKLEDFIKNSLGGQVLFTKMGGDPTGATPGTEEAPPSSPQSAPEPEVDFDFRYKPAEIKAHLDRFVIRQDSAKKVLATAVCDHYNHARMLQEERKKGSKVEFSKQNVVIAGPTGVGKTYLVKHIAELIGVPFVKADATKFSETGYVGGDVDDLVRDLVAKANGNVELAEQGIIYLDEIDKLAGGGGERMGRDVSGRGVQTALLKLMEETEVPQYAPNDMRSQMQMMFDSRQGRTGREVINTRNILFIVSGAFSGLDKIIRKRQNTASIGFGAAPSEEVEDEALLQEAVTQDFIDYGFEAEFIGRLPVRVVCEPLDAEALFEIMTSSEGSLIRQYEREFGAYGVRALFHEDALHQVSEMAAKEKTGARGLVTAWERILRDLKFEVPSLGLSELAIDGALVENPQQALENCRQAAARLQSDGRVAELQGFAREFSEEHSVDLHLQDGAIQALITRSEREGMDARKLAARLFKDYPFGLKLVLQSAGPQTFSLDDQAIADPDRYLSDLVVQSYGRQQGEASPAQQEESNAG